VGSGHIPDQDPGFVPDSDGVIGPDFYVDHYGDLQNQDGPPDGGSTEP
jgi:hypothetical protein